MSKSEPAVAVTKSKHSSDNGDVIVLRQLAPSHGTFHVRSLNVTQVCKPRANPVPETSLGIAKNIVQPCCRFRAVKTAKR